MPASAITTPYICARCLRANRRFGALPAHPSRCRTVSFRRFADSAPQRQDGAAEEATNRDSNTDRSRNDEYGSEGQEEGAMTRRMRELSEGALEAGGRSSEKAVSEAGFSKDLKKELEERIASANFRSEYRNAFTEAEMPSYAGRGTRDIATSDGWQGEESIHDASLRMLTDAHKPLRTGRRRIPTPAAPLPKRVDTGRGASGKATGTRLANARDRTSMYSSLKDSDMDAQEREKRFQELKARFQPDARSVVPGTIQGLSNLANQRIEDAIARGQFKNLPSRGKKIERDYNASNPFLDTTEYFMNKMIQKQEIVPPWIEKQQELVSAATKFRSRLRNDWKRHAARMIASKGGTLQEQMRRAEAYAKAELMVNPSKKKIETLNMVDEAGHLSQISLSGELKVPDSSSPESKITEEVVAELVDLTEQSSSNAQSQTADGHQQQTVEVNLPTPPSSVPPAPYPFRDPAWEQTEAAYHALSINDLNSKTRSYNLQAPDLAKKPYFALSRELNACYADVAPQLANAIQERAIKPQRKVESFGDALSGQSSMVDRLVGQRVRVRDERIEKQYGFKQFWKDVWGAGKTT